MLGFDFQLLTNVQRVAVLFIPANNIDPLSTRFSCCGRIMIVIQPVRINNCLIILQQATSTISICISYIYITKNG